MGQHTWFYRKHELSYEQAKSNLLQHLEKELELNNAMLDNKEVEFRSHYPEYTDEYLQICASILSRQIRMIKANLCKEAVCSQQWRTGEHIAYVKNKGFYVTDDTMPHDIFRIGYQRSCGVKPYNAYCNVNLFSLQETVNFIDEQNTRKDAGLPHWPCSALTEEELTNLQVFWQSYPDGMIEFG